MDLNKKIMIGVAIIFVACLVGIGIYLGYRPEEPEGPAEFKISNLTVSPSEAEPGESVEISATVKNVGDLEGTYTVELKIDGVLEETENVTLDSGESTTVSFTVQKETVNSYSVEVGDLIQSFEVIAPPSENIQDMMMETIATEKGVAKENVRICFYEQTMDNNIFAAGTVIRGGGSIVFLYDNVTRQITQTENEFAPTTNEEFQTLSIVVGTISPWTGEEIVPCEFTKVDDAYNFKFYDGYLVPFSRWEYGWATVYLDNETVEWLYHVE